MRNFYRSFTPLFRTTSLVVLVGAVSACTGGSKPNVSSSAESSNSLAASAAASEGFSSSNLTVSSLPISSLSSSAASSISNQIPANNFAVNGDIETGTVNWSARGAATIAETTNDQYRGTTSLLVSNRSETWHGAAFNVGHLTPNNEYEVSAWAKLAAGEPAAEIKITAVSVAGAENVYTTVATEVVRSDAWTFLGGTYLFDGAEPTDFTQFVIETGENATVSYLIDEMVVAGEVEPLPEPDPIPAGSGLKDLTDIPVGAAVSIADWNDEVLQRHFLNSEARMKLVVDNFSQISLENTMKMSYWTGANYSNAFANQIMQWAQTNNKQVHGHTLVWHPCYQVPSWANTETGEQYKQALTNHIKGVASQFAPSFAGEPGKIVSWDVVNEALFDVNDEGSYSDCRYEKGGKVENGVNYRRSAHFEGMGADYIATAFIEADKVTDADLYYNDFNTEENGDKTTSLIALLKDLNAKNVPIDGVGFQMHVLPDYASIPNIIASWQKVLDLNYGLKIKITELDVRVNNPYAPNFDPNNAVMSCSDTQALATQKTRYKAIVKAYLDNVPKELQGGITVWGLTDSDSWFATINANGVDLVGCPLLFDEQLAPKPAYDGVAEALNEAN